VRPLPACLGVIDGARTRDPQYHKLMLYQLSYDHHEGMQCAIRAAQFHHAFARRIVASVPRDAVRRHTVHNGFRGELGLRERIPEETSHERNGKHFHA
jgi:hypothetical protein